MQLNFVKVAAVRVISFLLVSVQCALCFLYFSCNFGTIRCKVHPGKRDE